MGEIDVVVAEIAPGLELEQLPEKFACPIHMECRLPTNFLIARLRIGFVLRFSTKAAKSILRGSAGAVSNAIRVEELVMAESKPEAGAVAFFQVTLPVS